MRFDDSLDTVLAAETSSSFGAQSAWRQLVDLIGRRRAPIEPRTLERLAALRDQVPVSVRAASARGLHHAAPPAALVRFFAQDDASVGMPILRVAHLEAEEWIGILPGLSPVTRSVLRHRRDLPAEVMRALEAFGAVDFVLGDASGATAAQEAALTPIPSPFVATATSGVAQPMSAAPLPLHAPEPVVVEMPIPSTAAEENVAVPEQGGTFAISDLVARIDAFQRHREEHGPVPTPAPAVAAPARFEFETDAAGVIRWVAGVAREPLVGLSLDLAGLPSGTRVDGVAAGAFRRRASFAAARLVVMGQSSAAGQWRISAIPVFDPLTGRFTGYRGTGRRPRADEQAEPQVTSTARSDSLRTLVHELRTPTNAIAGFSEMIETEIWGPVPEAYRVRAGTIRQEAGRLLAAIEDIDLAARIEGGRLDLRPTGVAVVPILRQVAADLAPLAELRGATLTVEPADEALEVRADDRAVERLVGRLFSALLSCSAKDEHLTVRAAAEGHETIALSIDRPAALTAYAGDALLALDAETEADMPGAPLLGTGFALRLARNFAVELGGSLAIGSQRLTLRLPASVTETMGQAFSN